MIVLIFSFKHAFTLISLVNLVYSVYPMDITHSIKRSVFHHRELRYLVLQMPATKCVPKIIKNNLILAKEN